MKRIAVSILIIILLSGLAACSPEEISGENYEERDLDAFNRIEVTGSVTLQVFQGDAQKVTLAGPHIDVTTTEIVSDTLHIGTTQFLGTVKRTTVEVTVPEILSVINRSWDAYVDIVSYEGNTLSVTHLLAGTTTIHDCTLDSLELIKRGEGVTEINRVTATNATLTVNNHGSLLLVENSFHNLFLLKRESGHVDIASTEVTGTFDLNVNDSGDINAGGSANRLVIKKGGSGMANLTDFPAARVEVTMADSGDVRVTPLDILTGSHSGSGSLIYYGNPEINVQITGTGTIRQIP